MYWSQWRPQLQEIDTDTSRRKSSLRPLEKILVALRNMSVKKLHTSSPSTSGVRDELHTGADPHIRNVLLVKL